MRPLTPAVIVLTLACTVATVPIPVNQPVTATPGAIVMPATDAPSAVAPPTQTPLPTATPTAAPTTTNETEETTYIGPESYPENVNPLTGSPVADPAVLERRPIVAKISNAPPLVRPQAGVGQADLVFEHYAEGGLTRLSAVYYDGAPERVGSVRSARLIDYELSAMYQAILAFSGGSTGVEEYIYGAEALGITEARLAQGREPRPPSDFAERAYKGVSYGPPYYFRDESIPVPHNLFVNPQALWNLATADGVNTPVELNGMAFDEAPPPNETGPATLLDVRYRATRAQWTYDPAAGVYLRTSDGQPHFDASTNQRVSAENVVVVYANHYFTNIVESEWQGSKSYSIEIQVWFEGDAVLVRDGRRYDVRWKRPARGELIYLETADGAPVPFKPGQTWFQLVRLPEQMEADSEWVRTE